MKKWIALFLAVICIQNSIMAKDEVNSTLVRPVIFDELVNCRTVVEADIRLACYDEKVAALESAQKSEEIIITDQKAIGEAKRGLFGFNLPKLKILGRSGEDQLQELTATIKSAHLDRRGKWVIILEDGAKWYQTDSKRLQRDAKPSMTIRIRPAALGSFFVNVDGQIAIRMQRLN